MGEGGNEQLIGPAEIQAEAVEELRDNGPLSYDELKESLGYSQATMQKIMRHIRHYNGLVDTHSQPDGSVLYTANINERIEPYIAGSYREVFDEFAENLSGKLDLDAVSDDVGHAVINASPSCLRDNQQRLEDEGFNTELYLDGEIYDEPTLLVHPRPGDLDLDGGRDV